MNRRTSSFALGLALIALSACATPPGTTLRQVDVENNQFVATDARLRMVTNSEIGTFSRPGLVDPFRIVCTEPSPDVAIAVANSFGAGISILGEGSGSVSGETVEGLGQLVERTASIQLLRDKMYQTCLAYSNGAISGTTYSLIMSRLDDTIVTLLLGETAGGAFGRSGASIGTAASAEADASLVSLPAAVSDVNEANAAVAEKQKKVAEAQQKLDEAEAAADDPPSGTQKTEIADLKKARDDAQAELTAALSILQGRIDTAAKAAGKATGTGIGGLNRQPSALIAESLQDMQQEFLSGDTTSEYVSACLVEFALQTERRDTRLDQAYDDLRRQILQLGAQEAEVALTQRGLENLPALSARRAALEAQAIEVATQLSNLQGQDDLPATEPTRELFGDVQESYRNFPDTVGLADYVASANLNRSSALANFCRSWLPGYLEKARDQFHELRKLRAQLEEGAAANEWEARLRQAEADRLRQIDAAVTTCKSIADSGQQAACLKLISSGELPALPPPSSDPGGTVGGVSEPPPPGG